MTIRELYTIIEQKRVSGDTTSYTRSLFADGIDRIAQKVGEESIEVVIAAKNNDKEAFVGEAADLVYHLLVLLAQKNTTIDDIEQKLQERHTKKILTTQETK
ncbi:MAG: phosphoribosyl-ATP diphosphatase [Acidobacteriota bacterium]